MSALESAFAGLESPDAPFVYAGILRFDRPLPLDALRAHVDAALATVPRYRQRIERRWLGADAWVDDAAFRIEDHVEVATVGEPGGTRELDALVAELLAAGVPEDRPPWRLYTVRGLAGGRGALVALVHHSLGDGLAGFRLLEHVLRGEAAPVATPPTPTRVRDKLAAVRKLARWANATALVRLIGEGLHPASQLGINPRHTGRARVVATHAVDLERVRVIERAFDATNNDVVLATVAGALRSLVAHRRLDPDRLRDARAMVPVGRHARGAPDTTGNRVVLLLTPLPIHLADPVERLLHVVSQTRRLKAGHSVGGGDLLVALSDATTPVVLTTVLRVALRMRGFNVIVTNIPGPRASLSLLGAQLTGITPIVNLWPHQALGVAAASYAGTMAFGVQADRAVIPDVTGFRDALATTFDALFAAASHTRAA